MLELTCLLSHFFLVVHLKCFCEEPFRQPVLAKDVVAGHASPANTAALCRFTNGAMAYVSACTEQWMPYVFNVEVFGADGAIRGNRFFSRQLPGATGFVEIPTIMPDSGDVAHHPFQGEIDHFVDCIRSGRESHVSLADAVNTHQACFAADQSARQGGVAVALPLRREHAPSGIPGR